MSTNTSSKWRGVASLLFMAGLMFVLLKMFGVGRFADDFVDKKRVKTYTYKKEKRRVLQGGYFACNSKDLFGEIVDAYTKKDQNAIDYLLKNGCIITRSGVEISILKMSLINGRSKVRVYIEGDAVTLYTSTENVYY